MQNKCPRYAQNSNAAFEIKRKAYYNTQRNFHATEYTRTLISRALTITIIVRA